MRSVEFYGTEAPKAIMHQTNDGVFTFMRVNLFLENLDLFSSFASFKKLTREEISIKLLSPLSKLGWMRLCRRTPENVFVFLRTTNIAQESRV